MAEDNTFNLNSAQPTDPTNPPAPAQPTDPTNPPAPAQPTDQSTPEPAPAQPTEIKLDSLSSTTTEEAREQISEQPIEQTATPQPIEQSPEPTEQILEQPPIEQTPEPTQPIEQYPAEQLNEPQTEAPVEEQPNELNSTEAPVEEQISNTEPQSSPEPEDKTGKTKFYIMVAIIVLAITSIGYAGYYFFLQGDSDTSEEVTEEEDFPSISNPFGEEDEIDNEDDQLEELNEIVNTIEDQLSTKDQFEEAELEELDESENSSIPTLTGDSPTESPEEPEDTTSEDPSEQEALDLLSR